MEQKVVFEDASVVGWTLRFLDWRGPLDDEERVLPTSYGKVGRRLSRVCVLLGLEELHITTHSFRRTGATHLLRVGTPLPNILLAGRWASEKSAREYLRRGDVSILALSSRFAPAVAERLQWLAYLGTACLDVVYLGS